MSKTLHESQEECKQKLEQVVRFNRNLQRNEVLTLHYLGQPYVVMSRSPLLRLKLPVSTFNYQDGDDCGIALQLIFTCPVNYPLQLPKVDLVEKRNVSNELELSLRMEIASTLERHLGLYMIVAVVTQLQMLLNNMARRLPMSSRGY
ncbi:uncharacterized protein LOC117571242 [Drosophila albomicans]|uniref:Uncharacterized protein LOC117571242 n=1 Tax=Drosophila albomicans TaxID=7291 RepID=A0A9C6WF63_DROAB|nr:uncharacterized protein LOC117571242 [Drosophila albomicans]